VRWSEHVRRSSHSIVRNHIGPLSVNCFSARPDVNRRSCVHVVSDSLSCSASGELFGPAQRRAHRHGQRDDIGAQLRRLLLHTNWVARGLVRPRMHQHKLDIGHISSMPCASIEGQPWSRHRERCDDRCRGGGHQADVHIRRYSSCPTSIVAGCIRCCAEAQDVRLSCGVCGSCDVC
jgi:hypothetical protein